MLVSGKNIRATALQEFWHEDFPESLYLWDGAKHNSTLRKIENSTIPTFKDQFSTQAEIEKGHEFCKKFYYRMLQELADRLNKIHRLNLPVSFWQIVFGYWLYRHISVVYDKYMCLTQIDIDTTSIKLLDKSDFYIPQNHIDYIFCFAGDFGVQQLVSQYYYLFKTKDFAVVNKTFTYDKASSYHDAGLVRLMRKLFLMRGEPQIVLCDVFFSKKITKHLQEKSQGQICSLVLPETKKIIRSADFEQRQFVANGAVEDPFESFFLESIYYCLPMDFLENFMDYYSVFQKDIKSRKFTHIVGESWISDIPNAIYIAVAKENNRKFISNEHGAAACYFKNCMQFIDQDVADIYLTAGWGELKENFFQGGFACRDIIPYQHAANKNTILYISRTKYIYWEEFNECNATNSTFIKELKMTASLIDLLPAALKVNFLFRPRSATRFWDVENFLELNKRNVKVDRGDFTESLSGSRIVVIDHMTTGFAEILLMKVPFILVYDVNFIPLSGEMRLIFNELIKCGVFHTSAQTAASHLSSIYEDVEGWWQSDPVRIALNKLINISLAPASKTTDYLMSLLSDDDISRPTLLSRILMTAITFLVLAFRVKRKIMSFITAAMEK